MSYKRSIFSIKKLTHPCLSFFAYWDSASSFEKTSEIRRFAKLKKSCVGKYSRVNPNCHLSNTMVGNFTAIGEDSKVGLGRHPMSYVSTHSIFYKQNNIKNDWVEPIELPPLPINIGNDVWIGRDTTILDGVTIGDGAVIGARSVVTKDVAPYSITAGVPAKHIKFRFDEETIERLLEIKWWDFSDQKISECINFFREPEVNINIINKYFK